MANQLAARFRQGALDDPNTKEKSDGQIAENNRPFVQGSEDSKLPGLLPFHGTGARAFIKVGGRPVGVTQNISWDISYTGTPIHTVDSVFPWDIDVGMVSIRASLTQIMDPTKGPEADGLFHVMQSAVHQPMVEMQVMDTHLNTSYFYAKGMFLKVSGNIARGAMSSWNAEFMGVAYQHYVAQTFKPYDSVSGALGEILEEAAELAGVISGGIL